MRKNFACFCIFYKSRQTRPAARHQTGAARPLQMKDSYRPDTTASLTDTSPCTYATQPPCTEGYGGVRGRLGN